MYVGLLTRFPGYTLDTIDAEDARLIRYVKIVDLAEGGGIEDGQ